jgi:tRNA(adenine34) deaminase
MENIINIIIKEAEKAYKKGDIPVGCAIVKEGKIVSKAYNLKENKGMATYHAEILAINKACKKLKTWHLDDCILYTTMEPCVMCSGAIIQSRIKKIVYILENESFGNIKNNEYFKKNKYEIVKIEDQRALDLMQNFFKNKR